jgi:hypothetical protein
VEHSLCTVWSPMSTKQIMFARVCTSRLVSSSDHV